MRVIFTGTRDAKPSDGLTVWRVATQQVPDCHGMTIIHGAAKGVDAIADALAKGIFECEVIAVPADWKTHGRAAGPIRNEAMLVEHQPDLVLAFPSTSHASKGTQDMVLRAKRAGVRTVVTWLP